MYEKISIHLCSCNVQRTQHFLYEDNGLIGMGGHRLNDL